MDGRVRAVAWSVPICLMWTNMNVSPLWTINGLDAESHRVARIPRLGEVMGGQPMGEAD